jgi:hypothetical protein
LIFYLFNRTTQKVPIHNCAIPDIMGSGDKNEGKIVGLPGAVDGPG